MSNMKRFYRLGGLTLIVVVGAMTWRLVGAPVPQLSMGKPLALPAVLKLGTSGSVTITIAIPDPTLVPGSLNLLRLNALGQAPAVIGQLHDDGQNGDLVAGDGIYSTRLVFNEVTPTVVQLQVSAAFRGTLRRVPSPVINVAITSDGILPLPGDPGLAGKTGLDGIDSDGDGLRDDVQRYIALTYPQSARIQSALTQIAKGELTMIDDSGSKALSDVDVLLVAYGLECLTTTGLDVPAASNSLEALILNTPQRAKAYAQADGQSSSFFYKAAADHKSRCVIQPSTLTN